MAKIFAKLLPFAQIGERVRDWATKKVGDWDTRKLRDLETEDQGGWEIENAKLGE